jgi:mRNA interferase MazF
MNTFISTVIIAPMTTKGRNYPSRVSCRFAGKDGQIVLDQIRTVDKMRLVKNVGTLDRKTQKAVLEILQEMFSE